MVDELVIICPELSPGSGGVGDYTRRVAEQWPSLNPRFLVANATGNSAGRRAEQLDRDARKIVELPPNAPVLLQYSAYGFHRFGYPRALLRALLARRKASQAPLVVMFHEIWTFWPLLNKNYPVQALHRRDIGALVRAADAVFTSTADQAEHLRSASGRDGINVLPVGSNVRPQATTRAAEPGLAVLFGLQGSRIGTLQKMQDDVRALAAAEVLTNVVTVGAGNSDDGDREERELLQRLHLRGGWEMRGSLPEEEVAALLSRAGFALSAQDQLSVTKSGTFMAYAAHALNIISPHSEPSAPEPLRFATNPEELRRGITEAELAARAEQLRAWHDRTCSWPRIAEEFARALRLPVSQSMTAGAASAP